jgi:hypothetical protein
MFLPHFQRVRRRQVSRSFEPHHTELFPLGQGHLTQRLFLERHLFSGEDFFRRGWRHLFNLLSDDLRRSYHRRNSRLLLHGLLFVCGHVYERGFLLLLKVRFISQMFSFLSYLGKLNFSLRLGYRLFLHGFGCGRGLLCCWFGGCLLDWGGFG